MKRESRFQSALVKEIEERYPGCIVNKNDPTHRQGFPDLLILCGDKWATLECKRSPDEHHQPNQDYWVGRLDKMSYSAFVFPENKDIVLKELDNLFGEKL